MRAHRRCFIGLAVLLMAVHAASLKVPASRGCCPRSPTGAVCTCCRPGSTDQCPMCRKTKDGPARCGAGCQSRETPAPSPSDVVAIVPDRTIAHVDLAAGAAPLQVVSIAPDVTLNPASPPP